MDTSDLTESDHILVKELGSRLVYEQQFPTNLDILGYVEMIDSEDYGPYVKGSRFEYIKKSIEIIHGTSFWWGGNRNEKVSFSREHWKLAQHYLTNPLSFLTPSDLKTLAKINAIEMALGEVVGVHKPLTHVQLYAQQHVSRIKKENPDRNLVEIATSISRDLYGDLESQQKYTDLAESYAIEYYRKIGEIKNDFDAFAKVYLKDREKKSRYVEHHIAKYGIISLWMLSRNPIDEAQQVDEIRKVREEYRKLYDEHLKSKETLNGCLEDYKNLYEGNLKSLDALKTSQENYKKLESDYEKSQVALKASQEDCKKLKVDNGEYQLALKTTREDYKKLDECFKTYQEGLKKSEDKYSKLYGENLKSQKALEESQQETRKFQEDYKKLYEENLKAQEALKDFTLIKDRHDKLTLEYNEVLKNRDQLSEEIERLKMDKDADVVLQEENKKLQEKLEIIKNAVTN